MRNETRVTMVAPSAGFTTRVMARIEERERVQARRRAVIGAGLFVAVIVGLLALVALWVASWIVSIATTPSMFAPMALVFSSVVDGWGTVLGALWVALMTITRNVSEGSLVVYAGIVLAMTALWAHLATGSFQLTLTHIRVGGSK